MVVTTRSKSQSHSGSRSSRIVPVPDDSEEEKRLPKPGDHIAVERLAGVFEHHGIYKGKEKGHSYPSVIHFQGPLKSFHEPSGSETCINRCGYKHSEDGSEVVTSCIDCFSKGKLVFIMQYMLQENLLSAKDIDPNYELKPGKLIAGYRSKTCYREYYKNGQLHGHSSIVPTKKDERSKLDPQVWFYPEFSNRTSQKVLQVAGKYKPDKYSVFCNNCEHFAVYCKTGEKKSKQAQLFNAEKMFCENGKRKRLLKSSSDKGKKRRKII